MKNSEPSNLAFEETRNLEIALLSGGPEGQVAAVLRALLDDPGLLNPEDCGAFTGRSGQKIVLIAPRLNASIGLPIKLGERVLWRVHIPSARILPSAQDGVCSVEDAQALLRWLRSSRPGFGIAFTDLMTDTPLYAAVMGGEALGYRLTNTQPAMHLFHCFRESYEQFFREKSSKYRNQLRRREKSFRERFGSGFSLKEYRLAEDVPEFLRAADAINKKTYQYKLFGESIDDTAESEKRFMDLAKRGHFRSFILWHERIPLCFVLGYQGTDRTFQHRKTGFDPEWREYAPGINCNILMLQKLYATDRPKLLDFGSGDADYKRLFANMSRSSCSPMLMPKTAGFFAAYFLYTAFALANEAGVTVLDRLGMKDRIKRLFRRRA